MRAPRIRLWMLLAAVVVSAVVIDHIGAPIRAARDRRRASALARSSYHVRAARFYRELERDQIRLRDFAAKCECRTYGEWVKKYEETFPGEYNTPDSVTVGYATTMFAGAPEVRDWSASDAGLKPRAVANHAFLAARFEKAARHHETLRAKYSRLAERFWDENSSDPPDPIDAHPMHPRDPLAAPPPPVE
jgi:hypothetical protein